MRSLASSAVESWSPAAFARPSPMPVNPKTRRHSETFSRLTAATDVRLEAHHRCFGSPAIPSLFLRTGGFASLPCDRFALRKLRNECDSSKRQIKRELLGIRHLVAEWHRIIGVLSNARAAARMRLKSER